MTNYEMLKNISIEEMAVTIMCPNETGMADIDCPGHGNCRQCCLDWLKSESL